MHVFRLVFVTGLLSGLCTLAMIGPSWSGSLHNPSSAGYDGLTDDGDVTIGSGSYDPVTLTFDADDGTDGTIVWGGANDEFEIANGNVTIKAADPALILDGMTGNFWQGVDDAGDTYQIGGGLVPLTNPFLTIDTTGKVGIGTVTPGVYTLNVNGLSFFGDAMTIGNNLALTWGGGDALVLGAAGIGLRLGANNSTTMTKLTTAGLFGIGTILPDAQLHVVAKDATTVGQIIQLADSPLADASQVLDSVGGEIFTIDAAGNVTAQNIFLGSGKTLTTQYIYSDPANTHLQIDTGIAFILDTADAAGNTFYFSHGVGDGLTDTNAEQSWVFIDPYIQQSGTAAYNGLKIDVDESGGLGDGTTGDGNNLIWIGVGAVNKFIVKNDGNVGVGTPTPSADVDIEAIAPELHLVSSDTSGDPKLVVAREGSETSHGLNIWWDNSLGQAYFDNLYDDSSGDIFFRTNVDGTPQNNLTLTGGGRVGVNDTNPTRVFQVRPTFSLDGIRVTEADGANAAIDLLGGNTYGMITVYEENGSQHRLVGGGDSYINERGLDVDFRIEGDTDQELFFLDAAEDAIGIGYDATALVSTTGKLLVDGNVGIGTATPSALLDIEAIAPELHLVSSNSSGDPKLVVARGGSETSFGLDIWWDNSAGSAYIDNLYDDNSGDIRFRTKVNGTPQDNLTITGDGRVSVNEPNPQRVFHVKPRFSGDGMRISESDSTTAAVEFLGFGGGGRLILYSGGSQAHFINGQGNTIFNENGTSNDIRTEGNTDQNLMYIDAGEDAIGIGYDATALVSTTGKLLVNGDVGIGTTTPAEALDVVGAVKISDVLRLTPQSAAPTGAAGDIYADSDLNLPCFYNGTNWVQMDDFSTTCA